MVRIANLHVIEWASGAALLVCLLAPPAFACPVCFSSVSKHVLETYYFTAVLMTLLPLLILGSIGGWLYVRFTRPRLP